MRDDRLLLKDMQEAIERIEKYVARGRDSLEGDELIQVWILYHLQIVGEAARSVSAELRQAHAEVPWSDIIGMRHVLVHRYFGIDIDLIWTVIQDNLPELKRSIVGILRDLSSKRS